MKRGRYIFWVLNHKWDYVTLFLVVIFPSLEDTSGLFEANTKYYCKAVLHYLFAPVPEGTSRRRKTHVFAFNQVDITNRADI